MGSSQSSQKDQKLQQQQIPQQSQQQQQIPQVQRGYSNNRLNKRQSQLQQQEDSSVIYNDDEPIIEQAKQTEKEESKDQENQEQKAEFNLEQDFQFSLKSMTKALKLSSKDTQTFPAMVTLDAKQSEKNTQNLAQNRPNLDLICVIDVSGSMMGQKIDNVISALLCLLELLQENDRIMLIAFNNSARRLLPLNRANKDNQVVIKNAIQGLRAGGGTNICSGMRLAMKALKERKFQNPVSSVFLLSDGQDYSGVVDYLKDDEFVQGTNFTIHSFGFGNDHDPELMNNICSQKDGNFYFVEKIDAVDEMFIDALGGLFSVVAQGLEIVVKLNKDNKVFGDVTISKTYGDIWKYDSKTNEYRINIVQFIAGVSKEYLMELELPPINKQLQDFERNCNLVQAEITMYANSDKEKKNPIKKQTELEITFYNEDEQIPEEAGEINENVQLNYLRVRGADIISEVMKEAEQGNYDKGQKLIDKVQKDIEFAKPQNRKKLQMLVDDLEESKQTCSRDRYQQEGRFKMISNKKAHMEKKSRNRQMQKCVNNEIIFEDQQDMYSNCVQTAFVNERRAFKKGF